MVQKQEFKQQKPYKNATNCQVRRLSPEDFVDLLVDQLGAEGMVCGENFRFGFQRSGDAARLKELGQSLGKSFSRRDRNVKRYDIFESLLI